MELNEWEEVKLDDLALYRRGSFPQPYGNPEWVDEVNGYPFIQVFDIDKNMKLKKVTKTKISDAAIDKSVFIEAGTVIVSLQGSIGRVAITQYDAYVDRTVLLFQSFKRKMNTIYFAYAIQELFEIEKEKAPGGTIKTITKQVLSKFTIRVPPYYEQRKIAKILSTWDKAIAATEKLIETSKQQKKALMQQLLTGKKRLVDPEMGKAFQGEWERHSMSDLVFIDRKSLGKKTPDDFEFQYISLSDVAVGSISKELEVHKFASAPSRARRVIQEGDILLSTVRPNLKGFAKVSEKHADCIASTGFSVLTPKKRVSGDYIHQYIFSSHVTGQIDSLVVGSNYPAINSSDVAGLQVYCPTYEEQQKIASVLTAADKEIEVLEAKLAHFKQEKKALMQQLLTGKKRVVI